MSVLSKGDIVTIFQDPATSKKPEGKAKLQRLWDSEIENGKMFEVWEVKFLSDGRVTERVIQVLPPKQKEVLDDFFSRVNI